MSQRGATLRYRSLFWDCTILVSSPSKRVSVELVVDVLLFLSALGPLIVPSARQCILRCALSAMRGTRSCLDSQGLDSIGLD